MMKKAMFAIGALLASSVASAHPGHAMNGVHWHPAEAIGLVLLGLLAGGAAWWMNRE